MVEIIPLEGTSGYNPHVDKFQGALEKIHFAQNAILVPGQRSMVFSVNLGLMQLNPASIEPIREALRAADFDNTDASLLFVQPGKLPNPPITSYAYGVALFPHEHQVSQMNGPRHFEETLVTHIFQGNGRFVSLAHIAERGFAYMGTEDIRFDLGFGALGLRFTIDKK